VQRRWQLRRWWRSPWPEVGDGGGSGPGGPQHRDGPVLWRVRPRGRKSGKRKENGWATMSCRVKMVWVAGRLIGQVGPHNIYAGLSET
jgi:hypothetical protein